MYFGETLIGTVRREFSFFKPRYNIDFNGWKIAGNFFEWNYAITDPFGSTVATVSKQVWKIGDTYTLDIANPNDAIYVLMFVLAMDAEKCTRGD